MDELKASGRKQLLGELQGQLKEQSECTASARQVQGEERREWQEHIQGASWARCILNTFMK
jgi:hypothetical protein